MLDLPTTDNTANAQTSLPHSGYEAQETQAMQRAVLRLLEKWRVTDGDAATILGGTSTKTLQRWRSGDYGRVSRDQADRMSNLLAIHKALRIIFSDPVRGYGWMSRPNAAFGGLSALDILRRGGMEDIVRLRRYLDSTRGGW